MMKKLYIIVCLFVFSVSAMQMNRQPKFNDSQLTLPKARKAFIARANINERNSRTGRTALHVAAWKGDCRLIEFLLDHGALINVQNFRGHTPLYIAVDEEKSKAAKLLIESGAEITETIKNRANKKGNYAIISALEGHEKHEAAQALMDLKYGYQ